MLFLYITLTDKIIETTPNYYHYGGIPLTVMDSKGWEGKGREGMKGKGGEGTEDREERGGERREERGGACTQ